MNRNLLQALVGLALSAALTMASFALKWNFDANARLAVMERELLDLSTDHDRDERQDKNISRHWRLHSWTRDQIGELRWKAGMPVASWPELEP